MESTKLELAAFDIAQEFIQEGQKFSFDADKWEIHAMVYGEPSDEWKDWMEEIASDFGLETDVVKFPISDYLKEQHHAEYGYAYVFR